MPSSVILAWRVACHAGGGRADYDIRGGRLGRSVEMTATLRTARGYRFVSSAEQARHRRFMGVLAKARHRCRMAEQQAHETWYRFRVLQTQEK